MSCEHEDTYFLKGGGIACGACGAAWFGGTQTRAAVRTAAEERETTISRSAVAEIEAVLKRAEAWGYNAGAVIRDVRSVLSRTLVVDDKRVVGQ